MGSCDSSNDAFARDVTTADEESKEQLPFTIAPLGNERKPSRDYRINTNMEGTIKDALSKQLTGNMSSRSGNPKKRKEEEPNKIRL